MHAVDKVIAKVVNVANADVDVARRRLELKAIIKEYQLLRLTIKLRL